MLGVHEVLVSSNTINDLYKIGSISSNIFSFPINDYVLLKDEYNTQQTAVAKQKENYCIDLVTNTDIKFTGIQSKNLRQLAFMHSLTDTSQLVSVATGKAGTGKSTIALAYALQQLQSEAKKKIYLTKAAIPINKGRAFGPVPGDVKDKYAPYVMSYEIILKDLLGGKSNTYVALMKEKGLIEYIPLEFSRGCTFKNCNLIVDEAQNLDWHELKTISSRIGENSKLILIGDLNQIDTRLHKTECGLAKMINSKAFIKSSLTSAVELETQYRSAICELVSQIDSEITNV